jgi:hypothetical protein
MAGSLPVPRAPERTDAQVNKDQQKRDGDQELLVIGALREAGSVHPQSPRKDNHEEKEEDACDFEPDDSAHAAERAQKASYATCDVLGRFSGSLTGGAALDIGLDGGLASWSVRSRLCAGGNAFARHAPGHPQADTEGPPDGLRFHSVMMVAATLAEPGF